MTPTIKTADRLILLTDREKRAALVKSKQRVLPLPDRLRRCRMVWRATDRVFGRLP